MDGYIYNTESNDVEVSFIDCFKGHDKYCINSRSTHMYYVLEGNGKFKINNEIFDVKKDDFIEIPPNTEFVYKGEMKLLLIMNPPFRKEDDTEEKDNDLY